MKTLSIGSAMIDTIAIIRSDRIERMAMANADTAFLLMEEGKKTEADAISNHLGGGSVNTAISFAKLGCHASVLARIGLDERGDMILEDLKANQVSTEFIIRDETIPTGASVILASHERNAGIFTFRGANTKLTEADLITPAFETDLVHIGSLSNESAALYPVIARKARSGGGIVCSNPGMRQLTSRASEFLNVLPMIDILVINKSEAEALMPSLIPIVGEGGATLDITDASIPPLGKRGLTGGGFEMTLPQFVKGLATVSEATIIITDGGNGVFIADKSEIFYLPALPAEIAGTAGAGDAFTSTFSLRRAQGTGIVEAALAAQINAASVIAHVDTQTVLLDDAVLRKHTEKTKANFTHKTWSL